MGYGVFDGTQLMPVNHIACHPDGEQFAHTGGKDDFRNDPGVGTGDNNGIGELPVFRCIGPNDLRNVTGIGITLLWT